MIDTLEKAKLVRPKDSYMASGSKKGIHTEHLGFILAEMQFLQRPIQMQNKPYANRW